MKIGLVSYEFRNNDILFNLSQMKRAVARTRGKVDLLCFGETFLQGFDSLNWNYDNDKEVAISLDSDIMEKICGLSLWGGVGLLFGYVERDGESLYSSCALADRGKVVHNYRRISKGWKEYTRTDSHYKEGASAEEFTYRDRKFMIALCGDLWDYPEQFRTDGVLLWPIYVGFPWRSGTVRSLPMPNSPVLRHVRRLWSILFPQIRDRMAARSILGMEGWFPERNMGKRIF